MGLVEQIFGDLGLPARFIIAFVTVLVLIGLTAWIIRRIAGGSSAVGAGRARQQRLSVIDAAQIDAKRRLVLIRRDNTEHLLLIGGPSDLVVESQITRGQPAAERQEPRAQPRMEAPAAAPQRRAPPVVEEPPVPPPPARPAQSHQPPPRPAPPPQSPPPQARTVPPPRFPQTATDSPPPNPAPGPRTAPAPASQPGQSSAQGHPDAHLQDMALRLESALVRPPAPPQPSSAAEERAWEPRPEDRRAPPPAYYEEDRKRDD